MHKNEQTDPSKLVSNRYVTLYKDLCRKANILQGDNFDFYKYQNQKRYVLPKKSNPTAEDRTLSAPILLIR